LSASACRPSSLRKEIVGQNAPRDLFAIRAPSNLATPVCAFIIDPGNPADHYKSFGGVSHGATSFLLSAFLVGASIDGAQIRHRFLVIRATSAHYSFEAEGALLQQKIYWRHVFTG
jgi:hypothetical protein